jgi:hypothetical protein
MTIYLHIDYKICDVSKVKNAVLVSIQYRMVYANFDLVRNMRARFVWWQRDLWSDSECSSVGNHTKYFVLCFAGSTLQTDSFLFEAMVLSNLRFCDFICIESCALINYSISYNIGTYSAFTLCKGGWEVSCRNSNNYTGLCGGVQGPGLAANN